MTCPSGYFCPEGTSWVDHARKCPAGAYCPAGSSNKTGAGDCTAGYYCPLGSGTATGNGACSPVSGYYCPAGSFVAAGTQCPAGKYCPADPSTSLYDSDPKCPAGYYCPAGTEDYSAHVCAAGKFCPTGSSNASDCPAGMYCPHNGASGAARRWGETNVTCPAGHYCPAGSSASAQCNPVAGNYCPEGSSVVGGSQCPPGHYCAVDTVTSLFGVATKCPAGYYCPAGTQDPKAHPCVSGDYCPAGSENRTTCAAEYYCPWNNVTQVWGDRMIDCTAGMMCPAGSSEPLKCLEGQCVSKGSQLGADTITTSGFCVPGRGDMCVDPEAILIGGIVLGIVVGATTWSCFCQKSRRLTEDDSESDSEVDIEKVMEAPTEEAKLDTPNIAIYGPDPDSPPPPPSFGRRKDAQAILAHTQYQSDRRSVTPRSPKDRAELEEMRAELMALAATKMQAAVRGHVARLRVWRMKTDMQLRAAAASNEAAAQEGASTVEGHEDMTHKELKAHSSFTATGRRGSHADRQSPLGGSHSPHTGHQHAAAQEVAAMAAEQEARKRAEAEAAAKAAEQEARERAEAEAEAEAEVAAIKIQAAYRGHLARVELERLKVQRDLAIAEHELTAMEASAVKLQAGARGHLSRLEAKRNKAAQDLVKAERLSKGMEERARTLDPEESKIIHKAVGGLSASVSLVQTWWADMRAGKRPGVPSGLGLRLAPLDESSQGRLNRVQLHDGLTLLGDDPLEDESHADALVAALFRGSPPGTNDVPVDDLVHLMERGSVYITVEGESLKSAASACGCSADALAELSGFDPRDRKAQGAPLPQGTILTLPPPKTPVARWKKILRVSPKSAKSPTSPGTPS